MTEDAVQIARLATRIEGQYEMLKTILDDAEKMREQLGRMQLAIDRLERDMADIKPVAQQFSNLRNMGIGALALLSIMGGTVFAIWQYAKSVLLNQ